MTTIFIKSWQKDFDFLQLCIKSIYKFVSGNFDIVLVIDTNDILPEMDLSNVTICRVKPKGNGYQWQQYIKLTAFEYTNADNILFIDSDTIFNKPINLDILKHEIIYTPYELVGDAICWKIVTEMVLERSVDYEFMRRLPLMYKRETLLNFYKWFKGDLERVSQIKGFSEFNVIGAYAYYFENEKYTWLHSEQNELPPTIAIQGWTWGDKQSRNNYLNQFKQILND